MNLVVWIKRENHIVTEVHYGNDDVGHSECPQTNWWSRFIVQKYLEGSPLLTKCHHTVTLITSKVLE